MRAMNRRRNGRGEAFDDRLHAASPLPSDARRSAGFAGEGTRGGGASSATRGCDQVFLKILTLLGQAVSASEHSVEARVALAQAIWNQASGEESLSRVEELLNQAIAVAQKNTSSTETAFLPLATSKLLLLLCLEGRSEEAKRLLQREGYEYRLSSEVSFRLPPLMRVQSQSVSQVFLGDLVCKNEDSNAKLRESLLCVLDDALPEDMLRHLQVSSAVVASYVTVLLWGRNALAHPVPSGASMTTCRQKRDHSSPVETCHCKISSRSPSKESRVVIVRAATLSHDDKQVGSLPSSSVRPPAALRLRQAALGIRQAS
eukprot:746087-Hanusia_phi.AAC.12